MGDYGYDAIIVLASKTNNIDYILRCRGIGKPEPQLFFLAVNIFNPSDCFNITDFS